MGKEERIIVWLLLIAFFLVLLYGLSLAREPLAYIGEMVV